LAGAELNEAALGAVKDGGEAEMQRPEARMLEWQLGVVELVLDCLNNADGDALGTS
jgi:hypothetical protein